MLATVLLLAGLAFLTLTVVWYLDGCIQRVNTQLRSVRDTLDQARKVLDGLKGEG